MKGFYWLTMAALSGSLMGCHGAARQVGQPLAGGHVSGLIEVKLLARGIE